MSDERSKAGTQHSRRRRFRLVCRALVALFTTLVCLLIGEFAFRVRERVKYQRRLAEWENELFRVRSSHGTAYDLHPSSTRLSTVPSTAAVWSYTIGESGFRTPDLGPSQPNEYRILALGDSYGFGWGVENGEPYPRVLEGKWRGSGRAVSVFNAGVPGYNTLQEAILCESLLPTTQPDMVLLGYVMNDAEPQSAVPLAPDREYRRVRSWLLEKVKQESLRMN